MRVGDILQKRTNLGVATVRLNETVAIAAEIFKARKTDALAVKDVCRTEGNVAVGLVTQSDVMQAIAEHGPNFAVSKLVRVPQRNVCASSDDLDDARRMMLERGVRHLLVIDDEILIGVISLDEIETTSKQLQ